MEFRPNVTPPPLQKGGRMNQTKFILPLSSLRRGEHPCACKELSGNCDTNIPYLCLVVKPSFTGWKRADLCLAESRWHGNAATSPIRRSGVGTPARVGIVTLL